MSKNGVSKYKLNNIQTFLIGFGFLASSLAWGIYNSQVPLMLEERFLFGTTTIGTIMTIDNFFGVIFQPLVGAWSDNTRTRFGKRMPWIMLGIPICAIAFALIPLQFNIVFFMAAVIIFNLVMALWRSPVISLMPDVTARPLRSKANGIINLMGGVGSVLAFLVGGILADLDENKSLVFLMGSIVMALSLVVLLLFVREPDSIVFRREKGIQISNSIANKWAEAALVDVEQADREHEQMLAEQSGEEVSIDPNLDESEIDEIVEEEDVKLKGLDALKMLKKAERKSLVFLLFAIFSWFMGYNAIETFFTLFATNTYNISDGSATTMLTGFSLAFLLFALPAGMIGQRLGRSKTIRLGLIGIAILFIPIILNPAQLVLQILLIGGGICWSLININSLPMVLEFASNKTLGSFTGYYYLFSFTAAIASPIIFGAIRDITNDYNSLFVYAVVFFVIALVCMFNVHHGDAVVTGNSKENAVEK